MVATFNCFHSRSRRRRASLGVSVEIFSQWMVIFRLCSTSTAAASFVLVPATTDEGEYADDWREDGSPPSDHGDA